MMTFGTVHFSRREMARIGYGAARDRGFGFLISLLCGVVCARPVDVRVDLSLEEID